MAEGQLYAPVRRVGAGGVEVLLGEDHPGFADAEYRARRNQLAGLSIDWQPGDPVPEARYSDVEHEVWRVVARELRALHEANACRAFLEAKEELQLPGDHIPQLTEVTDRLMPISRFQYLPVAGLAPLRDFYGAFGLSSFFSTQYIRHHSLPLYTPEPDIVHEVIGHANQIAVPEFADIYRLVGGAVERVQTERALKFLSQVFWFTFEIGVVYEDGEPKAYGAGILSSFGETEAYRSADIRPMDFAEMGTQSYDITRYQPVLFAARSMSHLVDALVHFYATFDDAECERLLERSQLKPPRRKRSFRRGPQHEEAQR
jgi:phenylalanine-4-hydroxylase